MSVGEMKIRPQILLAMVLVALTAGFAMWIGLQMGAVELVAGAAGGVSPALVALALKILEHE